MNSTLHKDAHFFWKNKMYDHEGWIHLVHSHPEQFVAPWEKQVRQFVLDWLREDEFVNVHTSGSTGPPKYMQLSKEVMRRSALMTDAYFGLGAGAVTLLCLPVEFIAGKMMIVRTFVNGWTLHFQRPTGMPLLDRLFDFVPVTPMQAANLLAGSRDLGKVKTLLLGGGGIPRNLEAALRTRYTNRAYHSYGMTETATHVAIRAINEKQDNQVFVALPDISFSTSTDGCLIVHAPGLGQPKLQTNDIVRLLDQKHFIWEGRKDNVINSGGIKLYPEQMEKKMAMYINSPFFVAGMPDSTLGQRAILVIEGREGEVDEPRLLGRLNKVLSKYEMVKSIHYLSHFPRTSSGKIIRGQANDMLKSTLDDPTYK